MIQIERISRCEEQRKLASFWSEPEAIFTAEHVHVRLPLAGGNRRAADPSEARRGVAARGARHHASLVLRRDGNLRGSSGIGQQNDLCVLLKEVQIGAKAGGWPARGWLCAPAAPNGECDRGEDDH